MTWISREEGSATRIASDAAMARLGIVPRRRLELPSYEAVMAALKRGYGVAAISRYFVATELRAAKSRPIQRDNDRVGQLWRDFNGFDDGLRTAG